MKRIPLATLRKILRVGDYVAYNKDSFYLISSIEINGFYYTSRNSYYYESWDSTIRNAFYWLPGDLLESTDTISKIKAARLKESKRWTQEEIDKAKIEAAKIAKELNWLKEQKEQLNG